MAFNQPYGMPYGYQNYPYGQMPNYNQQQPQQNYYAIVNGLEGAKNYQIGMNQTMLLMDSTKPIAYKKTANGLGQTSIECYKLVQITEQEASGSQQQPQQETEYATKEEINALNKRFDSLVDKIYGKPIKNENKGNSVQNKGE